MHDEVLANRRLHVDFHIGNRATPINGDNDVLKFSCTKEVSRCFGFQADQHCAIGLIVLAEAERPHEFSAVCAVTGRNDEVIGLPDNKAFVGRRIDVEYPFPSSGRGTSFVDGGVVELCVFDPAQSKDRRALRLHDRSVLSPRQHGRFLTGVHPDRGADAIDLEGLIYLVIG